MAQYNVIFRDDQPKWQPGCPVYVSVVQVARNVETGQCFLQLKLQNLTDVRIDKIILKADITSVDGRSETITLEYLDAMMAPGGEFTPQAAELPFREIAGVQVYADTVGKVTGFAQLETPPAPQKMELSPKAEEYRNAAITALSRKPASAPFAMSDNLSWWQCTCGAVNVGNSTCRSCGIFRTDAERISNAAAFEIQARDWSQGIYDSAKASIAEGTLPAYEAARKELAKIPAFQDAAELIVQLDAAIADAKDRVKAIQVAEKKKTTKVIIIAVAAVVVIVVAAIIGFTAWDNANSTPIAAKTALAAVLR